MITTSRPRFRGYVLGPYLIGFLLGSSGGWQFATLSFWIMFLYFLFPANVWIYGLNDLCDQDTDIYNPKKQGYEKTFFFSQKKLFLLKIIFSQVPFLFYLGFSNLTALVAVIWFLVISMLYSSYPVRAKVLPFLDGIYNVLYIIPGVVGYFLAGGVELNSWLIIGGRMWCMAMHCYSAIPDIDADTQAGLQTSATVLGFQKSLWYVWVLYMVSTGCLMFVLEKNFGIGWWGLLFGIVYSMLVLVSTNPKKIFEVYKKFPLINMVVGTVLFWLVVLLKFS